MDILTSADLATIRNKIDYRLTAVDLPDALIQGYVDEAEIEVIALLPNHDQLDTEQTNRLKLAVIYWAAYLLAHAVPILIQDGVTPNFEKRFDPIAHEKRIEWLMDTRDKHLAYLDVHESQPVVFELDEGYKDKLRRAEYWSGKYPILKYLGEKRRGTYIPQDGDD